LLLVAVFGASVHNLTAHLPAVPALHLPSKPTRLKQDVPSSVNE
jgi:hypothetical protein